MSPKLLTLAKSSALTFATACGLELYAAMQSGASWGDIGWVPLLSAVTFTAVRTTLKALLELRSGAL